MRKKKDLVYTNELTSQAFEFYHRFDRIILESLSGKEIVSLTAYKSFPSWQ